jgi:hypothetical protein
MFVGTGDGNIYVSYDHITFYKLTITGVTITGDITDITVDSKNNLWVATQSMGIFRLGIQQLTSSMGSVNPDALQDVLHYDMNSGMPSYFAGRLVIDASDTIWVATDNGLVRIIGGVLKVFTTADGLPSNVVNDITIVNNGLRFIATSNGIAEMNGSSITKINIEHAEWNGNVKSVTWKNPNLLFASSMSNLFQIEVTPDGYDAYAYPPSAYTGETTSYDDLKTYLIVGVDPTLITENSLVEVFVNKRNIKHGFSVSQKDGCWAITFLQPLNRNDIVEVVVRNDITLYADLQQNRAEQIAYGKISRVVKKFITDGIKLYATTNNNGQWDSLLRYDYSAGYQHPYDKIGLDTKPPTGTLTFDTQIDRRHVQLSINDAIDNLSGIDSMRVSNYPNFTSDGNTPVPWISFATQFNHDLGLDLGLSTVQLNFSGSTGSKLAWFKNETIDTLYACSSSPAVVYSYNPTTYSWTQVASINTDKCKFLTTYKNKLVLGTGSSGGTGKIFVSIDGSTFNLLASIDGEYAYCATVLNEILYIGTGPNGKIYSYDGTNIREVYSGLGTNIYSLSGYNTKLYASTGEQGRLYAWDPVTNVALISNIDTDSQLNAVLGIFVSKTSSDNTSSSSSVSGDNVIFLGTNNTSRITKSVNKNPFITSFAAVTGHSVKFIKVFNGTIYAAIDRTLYYYQNSVWLAKKSLTVPIEDVYVDVNDNVWIITGTFIYFTKNDITQKTIYLQLRDRAGNETEGTSAGLNINVSINDLQSFTHVNRILEVDEYGTPIFNYDGDSTFYSAERITEEQGVYLSEIFNGTNDHVMWSEIYWDAVIPNGTDLTVSIRSAATKDALLAQSWTDYAKSESRGVDISSFSGQFIQFKLTLTSTIRGLSPSIYKVVITSVVRESVHYFTTNFIMPSRVTKGILTSTSVIPVSADIIFGVNTNDSTDFTDYQVIEPNKLFTLGGDQSGKNLRIGAKLISPARPTLVEDDYAIDGNYVNVVNFIDSVSSGLRKKNYTVSFYTDEARTNIVATLDTAISTDGWSLNGAAFPTGGTYVFGGSPVDIIASIEGLSSLRCNQHYYVTIKSWDGVTLTTIDNTHTFIAGCNTTFVDDIHFRFTNTGTARVFSFRVRVYSDVTRASLVQTYFSNLDNTGWTQNDAIIPTAGVFIMGTDSKTIKFLPDVSMLSYDSIYYLVIDAYNGINYTAISKMWTFRIQPLSSEYCGEYMDVPILKNFAIMFELENGEFVMLNA